MVLHIELDLVATDRGGRRRPPSDGYRALTGCHSGTRMRAFTCPVCRHLVTFENTDCLRCGTALGFDWEARSFVAGGGCANRDLIGCNGVGPGLCTACALTRTRPPDAATAQFAVAEAAKRRLVFELLELGLPIDGGLTFDFLSSAHGPVTTGHANGVITLDLAETDPVHRERTRTELAEPYRTVLGHLRHEIGHYYQPVLAPEGSAALGRCRELMGDDRQDYSEALDRHYETGPPADWADRYVSAYATMHPWEDWAETFAHYLHIRDVLQTAIAYGVSVAGPAVLAADAAPLYSYPAAEPTEFRAMLDALFPLTYALNAINRSLGEGDLYPFVLTPAVIEKLALVDSLVRN